MLFYGNRTDFEFVAHSNLSDGVVVREAERRHWYRGFRRSEHPPHDTGTHPTLICWGEDDIALRPAMAEESLNYFDTGELRTFPDASHWVHHERDAVTTALCQHLTD